MKNTKIFDKSLQPYKQRCSTLPAKDLSRISQTFTSDCEYIVMSRKLNEETKTCESEGVYLPMSQIVSNIESVENPYIVMSGRNNI